MRFFNFKLAGLVLLFTAYFSSASVLIAEEDEVGEENYFHVSVIDNMNTSESRMMIGDRAFEYDSSLLIYAKDGSRQLSFSDLREGMRVGCVLNTAASAGGVWTLKEIWVLSN